MYSVLPATAYVPTRYPLFKQYDYRWANDTMVSTTVAAVGCLMSSTSMALNANGICIPTSSATDAGAVAATPGTLNAWLRTHKGYTGSNDMEEAAIPAINTAHVGWTAEGMHRTNDLSIESVATLLESGQPVIANVLHGHNFVLVVGTDRRAGSTTLFVNDPGFYRNSCRLCILESALVDAAFPTHSLTGIAIPPRQMITTMSSAGVFST